MIQFARFNLSILECKYNIRFGCCVIARGFNLSILECK